MTENQIVKPRVLFLCVSNSARSQMAEAFLRSYAGDKYEAYSAGTDPRDIHPLTRKVMSEIGIDMSAYRSKSLKDYMGRVHFGYLVTVCSEADENCPTHPACERSFWRSREEAFFQCSAPRLSMSNQDVIRSMSRLVRHQKICYSDCLLWFPVCPGHAPIIFALCGPGRRTLT
jgi:arsenate reductase (thioredoxin)